MSTKLPSVPPLASIVSGNPLLPMYPQTFEEVYRFANTAFKAGMLPRQTKREKIDGKWQAVEESDEAVLARGTMLLLQAMEIGMPPMAALQLMALINGRISVHSEGVPGLLLARGCKIKRWWTGTGTSAAGELIPGSVPDDSTTHHTEIVRPDGGRFSASFSVADAKRAGLWQTQAKVTRGYGNDSREVDNDSPWFRYWQRMMPARSLGFAAKDGAADYMRGIAIREEIEDMARASAARDVTPRIASTKPARQAPSVTDIPDDDPPEASTSSTPASDDQAAVLREIERRLMSGLGSADEIRSEFAGAIRMMDDDGRQAALDAIDAAMENADV